MFCYGKKRTGIKDMSSMLSAVDLDGQIITESDRILASLGIRVWAFVQVMNEQRVVELRNLERRLFQYWCRWLC